VTAYRAFIDVEGYCRICSIEEIENNGFSLDVGRYVKPKRAIVPKVDLRASLKELDRVHRMQVNEYDRVLVKAGEIVEYLGSMDQER
jgi:type I restriction-modification system DNA methylase subunit